MVSGETMMVKVSFSVPENFEKEIFDEAVREMILDLFGAFNVYDLKVKRMKMKEELK